MAGVVKTIKQTNVSSCLCSQITKSYNTPSLQTDLKQHTCMQFKIRYLLIRYSSPYPYFSDIYFFQSELKSTFSTQFEIFQSGLSWSQI